MSNRYKAVRGSQSRHCCFEITVVDTSIPDEEMNKHYKGQYYEVICECFEDEYAATIVRALNSHDRLVEENKILSEALARIEKIAGFHPADKAIFKECEKALEQTK